MKNWIKTHVLHTLAIIALAIILTGVCLLLPYSPWTLITGGFFMLLAVGFAAIPDR